MGHQIFTVQETGSKYLTTTFAQKVIFKIYRFPKVTTLHP